MLTLRTELDAEVAAAAAQRLLVSPRFIEGHTAEADALVKSAADRGAQVTTVSASAAERLDAAGGGVCALLRFVPYVLPAAPTNRPAANAS